MIQELQILDKTNTPVDWWSQVERLKRRKSIKFKPGLNILWGPNGCGKTTILLAMARMFHAWQGGHSVVTEHSMHEMFRLFGRRRKGKEPSFEDGYKGGITPIHDGQSVFFIDPAKGAGHGHSSIDGDFIEEQLMDLTNKGSSGQKTVQRLGPIAHLAEGNPPPPVGWRVSKDYVNDVWVRRLELVEETFKGTIPKGQPTVLLDEPDRSLDIPTQHGLWRVLKRVSSDVQVIVATHSMLALEIPGAHYLDLRRGYLKECREVRDQIFPR